MNLEALDRMIAEDAALRRRQRLQPVGGPGDKIFPPTYPGEGRNEPPRHVYERRMLGGQEVWCVLVDSPQSQANRLEECLLEVHAAGAEIPHVVVDFSDEGLAGIRSVTSLDAPHRVYDAILRDSLLGDQPFMRSELGRRLATARPNDATAVLEVSPNALLFGSWHSTGEGGGLGAKFARCLTSEIVAVNVPVDVNKDPRSGELQVRTAGQRTGSRMDPIGTLRKVEVFKGDKGWDTTAAGAGKKAKQVRPSEINHGNIAPSIEPLGITCEYLEHTFVLSFAALRRLQFGDEPRTSAGRALLVAMGLLAMSEQDARGYALRSRCDLVCDGRLPMQIVHADGGADTFELNRDGARDLYTAALSRAKSAGFDFALPPRVLKPQAKLVSIVRRSQELALEGEGGEQQASGEDA